MDISTGRRDRAASLGAQGRQPIRCGVAPLTKQKNSQVSFFYILKFVTNLLSLPKRDNPLVLSCTLSKVGTLFK